jgi:uncharacterized protein (DUF305 family)
MRWTSLLHTALLCTALAGISACSGSDETDQSAQQAQPQTTAPIQQEAPSSTDELVEHARALYERSVSLGFAWVATRQQVDAAAAALSAGDDRAARTAAQEAIALAEASIAQAEREALAWQDRMPFNQPDSRPSN